ncbi:hypothetical protein QLQ12_08840 [Actinoplanes sp. NEAU-A12]|uniref:Uncharacterized protein n=1 Tax=Actinoplanes sandaracinus TaxID=3045177 RepID=A0ABT6WG75_9ACTN|nr:hypothetical protein [Actinoplanes sandaracinus]MDI6098705.1 hypothetical protein [Actinoplanes sandaracinus]
MVVPTFGVVGIAGTVRQVLDVAKGIAGNPAADTGVLLRLLNSGVHSLYFTVIYRRDLPVAVYDAVVIHADPKVRGILADCWNAPAKQRARLASDPDPAVRAVVAIGPEPFRMVVEPLPEEIYVQPGIPTAKSGSG